MTEDELEQRINNIIDNDYEGMTGRFENESITRKVRDAILAFEKESLKKAVEQVENVSRL